MIYRKRSEKLNLVLFLCLFCFVLFFLDNFFLLLRNLFLVFHLVTCNLFEKVCK